ncbi:GtrA family protein [Actinophytocola sp.]|uniref:GtrA family protein n=1 Tax=Actinophytocola sp. TaxID=1872138 RepID=UPI003D6B3D79
MTNVLTPSPERRQRAKLWGRYTAASVIAGVISELVFLLAYWFEAAPVVASVVAFVAGAVPNYLMNRRWAWRRTGRPHPVRETLPYAVIIVSTALVAILATTLADRWVVAHVDSHELQVFLVGAAFLGTYGVMFVLKFVLFDRLFAGRPARTPGPTSPA